MGRVALRWVAPVVRVQAKEELNILANVSERIEESCVHSRSYSRSENSTCLLGRNLETLQGIIQPIVNATVMN